MELTLGRPSLHEYGSPFTELHAAHEDRITPKMRKIEAYLKSLEDERQKIEAFKRELPICMQLLSNEIEASREQLYYCKNEETCTSYENSPPCKADFMIPLELNLRSEEPNNCESLVGDDGARLPTSSCAREEVDIAEDQEVVMANELYRTRPIGRYEKDLQACSRDVLGRKPGGAFVPFLKDGMRKPLEEAAEVVSLSHAHHQDAYLSPYFSGSTEDATHQDVFPTASKSGAFMSTSDGASYQEIIIGNNGIPSQPSPQRKPRRCWPTELHRKFVNALKELGGSEVATPKQIRELMQVDGLTNDEIKSHLQKYRLHTKRPKPVSVQPRDDAEQAPKETPQLVVLGGIWVPQEYPLKQGLGHALYINPVPHLMNQTLMKQGQPLFYQNHIHTQQHATTH